MRQKPQYCSYSEWVSKRKWVGGCEHFINIWLLKAKTSLSLSLNQTSVLSIVFWNNIESSQGNRQLDDLVVITLCLVPTRDKAADISTGTHPETRWQWRHRLLILPPAALETSWRSPRPAQLHVGGKWVLLLFLFNTAFWSKTGLTFHQLLCFTSFFIFCHVWQTSWSPLHVITLLYHVILLPFNYWLHQYWCCFCLRFLLISFVFIELNCLLASLLICNLLCHQLHEPYQAKLEPNYVTFHHHDLHLWPLNWQRCSNCLWRTRLYACKTVHNWNAGSCRFRRDKNRPSVTLSAGIS